MWNQTETTLNLPLVQLFEFIDRQNQKWRIFENDTQPPSVQNDNVFNLINDKVYKKSLYISNNFIFEMVLAIGPNSMAGRETDGSVLDLEFSIDFFVSQMLFLVEIVDF
jgi:hypothetical protein